MDVVRPQKIVGQKPVMAQRDHSARKMLPWYFLFGFGLVVIILLMIWWVFLSSYQKIDSSKYQVVYMTNGQAYFGKLKNSSGEYLVLDTPYTAQSVETPKQDEQKTEAAPSTLLKVSSQVYGPEDSIAIRSSQVAFWQNLRSDSKVSKAIDTSNKE